MTGIRLRGRLIDSLYTEAMVLADEARSYFDQAGRDDRDRLTPLLRVTLSCESLKITTRLMNMLSWLLTQRAVELGQVEPGSVRMPGDREDDDAISSLAGLPEAAIALIESSRELQARVRRIDSDLLLDMAQPQSPALGLLNRLERAF